MGVTEESLLAGRYAIGTLLGSGGMATVHRAHDTLLDREVAIKLVAGVDPDDAERFRSETRVLARLHHPAVVTLFDAGTDGDRAFLVMQLIEGPSLRERLRDRGPLSRRDAARLGATLAEALASVHAAGVTHRDVKPANVLLDAADRPHLADFGIATALDSARLTRTGTTVGTAAYLAPEQVTGEKVGPPADVFALGLVLLEAITGVQAYEGTGVEVALARLHRSPGIPPDVPQHWRTLLTAATARDPAGRPTATELAQRLGAPAEEATALEVTPGLAGVATPGGVPDPGATEAMPAPSVAASGQTALLPSPPGVMATAVLASPGATASAATAPPRRRRNGLLIASIAGVVAAGLVGGVLLAGGSGPQPGRSPTPEASAAPTPPPPSPSASPAAQPTRPPSAPATTRAATTAAPTRTSAAPAPPAGKPPRKKGKG